MINSKSNEKVKFIKSLNEKKFREKENAFYIEGVKVVLETLENKAIDIMFIAYSQEILSNINGGSNLLDKIQQLPPTKLLHVDSQILKYITDTMTPQGVVAVIHIPRANICEISNNNILILDKIQDAGNIGTIIRSCDAFNINTIICIKGTTDVYSPKVVRSTMGSILRLNIIYIDEDDLERLKTNFTLVSTTLDSTKYINELDFTKKYAFILGNEANGIGTKIQNISDECVKIKMTNTAESLNVAVAAGIILYEQYIHQKK